MQQKVPHNSTQEAQYYAGNSKWNNLLISGYMYSGQLCNNLIETVSYTTKTTQPSVNEVWILVDNNYTKWFAKKLYIRIIQLCNNYTKG